MENYVSKMIILPILSHYQSFEMINSKSDYDFMSIAIF